MASSYREVLDGLKALKASGASRADAEQFAAQQGWSFDDLKRAKKNGGTLTNITAPILQGLTLGFGDEISAGLRTGFGFLGDYDDALADERAVLQRAQADNPIASTVLEFGGALGPGIAAAPAAIGKTLLGTVGKSAAQGAGLGAAYGFGSGEGDARLEGAAAGAVTGGVLGGALPVAGEALKAGYRGVRGVLTPETAAKAEIVRAVARDGMDANALRQQAAKVAQGGQGSAILADAGGENVQGLLERVAQTPGAGRNKVIPALEARQKGQLTRIADGLRNLTGTKQGAFAAIDESVKRAKQQALPLKKAAMQVDITTDEPLQAFIAEMVTRDAGKKALKAAQKIASNQGRKIGEGGRYSMEDADLLFRGLRDVIDKNTSVDQLGRSKVSQVGQSVIGIKDKFRSVLDTANPDYAKFRKMWSGEEAFRRAADKGRKIERMSSDELADFLKRASAGEGEGFTIGAVSHLAAKMGNNTAKLPDLTKVMRSPEMRAKIDMLLPDDASRKAFAQAFDFEEGVSDLTRKATGNSATARRLAEQEERQSGDLIVDIASEGVTPGAAMFRRLFQVASSGVRDTLRSRTDDKIADVLLSPNPSQLDALIAASTKAPLGYGAGPGRVAVGSAPAVSGLLVPDAKPFDPQLY